MTERDEPPPETGADPDPDLSYADADGHERMICPTCATQYDPSIRFCPNDGATLRPTTPDADELIGTIIDDRYYLRNKLGQGGMADVYLGQHVRAKRLCAVKVVNPNLASDQEALSRFIREATNAGQINHPHVATIYDIGETADGLLYIAMEYVDGEPLSALLEREGALPPARAVEIARQVAEAVGAAHELGIVHRDLKPGNIMIARDRKGEDVVKVVDFGIARTAEDDQQRLTRTGLVIGTPAYMSPEQLIGDPVDARSDIYSLGCILFQMLTGEHAFGGTTAQIITRRLTKSPPPPRSRNPAVPKRLDEVTVTALGRIPAERYQTMEDLREALLAAPVRPVTTGPSRLRAWLGLEHGDRAEAASSDVIEADAAATDGRGAPDTQPLREAAPPAAADSTAAADEIDEIDEMRPAGGAGAMDFTPLPAEPLEPAPSSDRAPEADWEPPGADTAERTFSGDGAPADPDAADDDDRWGDAWESEEQHHRRRRRRTVRRVVIAAGMFGLLLASAMLMLGRGADEPSAPEVRAANSPVTALAPPAPEGPPATTLDDIDVELALAEREVSQLEFSAAIGRLLTLRERIGTLMADYPDAGELVPLADSVQTQLESVRRRCSALRAVALERNEPAPVCEPAL